MNSMGPPPLKSVERPPLITPSASPPPSRFTHRNPDSDGPSPTKRQRLFSTPRLTVTEQSSSVSRPQSPVDVQKEREASKLRLFDVWAGLAERYNVPVEDDDLVNIRTGKVTKDNGFLRKHRTLDFGTIAAPTLGADDEDSEEEEDEYDVDELDAFADENLDLSENEDVDVQNGLKLSGPANPFASILRAADEEDLREFMKAEQERKALCGSDIDNYEDDDYSSEEEYLSSSKPEGQTESELEQSAEPDREPTLEPEMDGEEQLEEAQGQVEGEQTHQGNLAGTMDRPISFDLGSEDELDDWNENEASIVYPVVKAEPPEDHISTGEEDEIPDTPNIITDLPVVVKSSDNHNKIAKVLSRPKSMTNSHQLHTPPQSQSSSRSSAAPNIDVIELSSSTDSSPPPSTSVSRNSSKVQSTASNSKIPVAFQRRPLQGTNKKPTTSKAPPKTSPKLSTQPKIITPKRKPYVLLTPRNALSPKATAQTESLSSEDENAKYSPSKAPKGKGKAKAVGKGPQPPKPDNTRPKSSRPSDARRESTRPQIVATSQNGEGGSVRTLSGVKTRSGVQGHRDPPSSKAYSKDIKNRSEKSFVASDHGQSKVSPSLPSSSTHRKRKRTSPDSKPQTRSSNVQDLDPSSNQASASRVTLDQQRKGGKVKQSSSSRKRETSSGSGSESGLDADSSASESEGRFRSNKMQPQVRASMPPAHHPYHHMAYPPSHYPPHNYPPIPDPRAQLIITQAMHQLSALVSGSWGPPQYGDGQVPYTPTHRHHDGRPSVGPFLTPTHHPHRYPYAYDPNYSSATLPPDSSEIESSPHKQSSGRRKSLVKRSQSRGRRVSFRMDDDESSRDAVEGRSSPSPKEKEHRNDSRSSSNKRSQSKGREIVQERHEESSGSAELDYESDRTSEHVRGRTPGPSSDRGRSGKRSR